MNYERRFSRSQRFYRKSGLANIYIGMPVSPDISGFTVREVARRFRVSKDKVRGWIRTGELRAANTANPGEKPRFVVSQDAIADFEIARNPATATPKKNRCRGRRLPLVEDFLNAA